MVPWVSECFLCLAFAASGRGHEDTVEPGMEERGDVFCVVHVETVGQGCYCC